MYKQVAAVLASAAVTIACGGASGPLSSSLTVTAPSSARIPRLARTRFVAFGDSITIGEVTAPIASAPDAFAKFVVVPSASYPSVLQASLRAAYPLQASSITVLNEGTPAESVVQGSRRFDAMFAAQQPEVVLLEEGVNGVAVDGPDASANFMRQMVIRAKAGNAAVFVGATIPSPPNRLRSQNAAVLEAYNAALRAMCAQEGVAFVDLYNAMLPEADQLIGLDGLHPTEAGYRRIADLFFAAIRSQLEQ